MSEITIHTGSIGAHNKIYIDWFDENGCQQRTVIEADIQNYDKPRTLVIAVNGKKLLQIPEQPSLWCEHIALNTAGRYEYNGMDTRQWKFCPKCGKAKPVNA